MKERIGKFFDVKYIAVFLVVIYLISLVPLCLIGQYNFPCADDFSNGSRAFHVWNESHSLGNLLIDCIKKTVEEYLTWRGCYTSIFLSSLPPFVFGQQWNFLTPLISLLLVSGGVVFLMDNIIVKVLRGTHYHALCISMLMLLISVQCLPSVARCELLYWYSGACNYAYIHALLLFFYGLLIGTVNHEGKRRRLDLFLGCVLGFLAAGGNQMSALNGMIIIVTLIVVMVWKKQWSKYKFLALPLVSYVIGFGISMAAPGDLMRMDLGTSMGPIKAILVSLYYTFSEAVNEWTTWSVILLELMTIPFFWNLAKRVTFRVHCPFAVVAYGYGVVSAMMTPPLFAVSNIEAGRIRGLTYWMYILVLTLCVGYCVIWLYQKIYGIVCKEDGIGAENRLSHSWSCFLIGCSFFFVVASGLTLFPEGDYFVASSAVTDMINGKAQGFAFEMSERLELYENSTTGVVEVYELEHHPELLFFSDLKPDSSDWENMAVVKYFDLKEVIWKPRNS